MFQPVSVAEQAGVNLTLSETPKRGFLASRPISRCVIKGLHCISMKTFLLGFNLLSSAQQSVFILHYMYHGQTALKWLYAFFLPVTDNCPT